MIDDLWALHRRYGDDLEQVIPFFEVHVTDAQERLLLTPRRNGAIGIWNSETLPWLWRHVRAHCQLHQCTIDKACAALAKRGYEVSTTDYDRFVVQERHKTVRSKAALRAAYYKADREFRRITPDHQRGYEADVQMLIRLAKGELPRLDLTEHRRKVARWNALWTRGGTQKRSKNGH
jgi:hypothetical protein